MRLACRYTADDYKQGYRTYVKHGRRRWSVRFYLVVGVLFLLMALIVVITPKNSLSDGVPLFLLGVLWIYVAAVYWRKAARRAFNGRPELQQDYSIEVDETGVLFAGQISRLQWTWPAFVRFAEGKNTFLLFLSPCAFVILPKRIFAPGEADQFRELACRKMPAR